MKSAERRSQGFTLVEALVSIVILAIMAATISGLFMGGLQTIGVQQSDFVIDSCLRSQMEYLLAEEFAELTTGSDTVSIGGQDYSRTWTISAVDLDGDTIAENDAVTIVVEMAGHTLSMLRVDAAGQVRPI